MNNIISIKKITILLLTLIIPGICLEKVISQKDTTVKYNEKVKTMDIHLKNTTQWKSLVTIWKNLTNSPQKVLNQTLEKVVQENLDYLESNKLISNKEKSALEEVINTRISHIRQKHAAVRCYDMTVIGAKIYETKEDLELRYSIMEKLFQDGKVSDETFKITKNDILKDINIIENTHLKALSANEKADLLEVIISLNK